MATLQGTLRVAQLGRVHWHAPGDGAAGTRGLNGVPLQERAVTGLRLVFNGPIRGHQFWSLVLR